MLKKPRAPPARSIASTAASHAAWKTGSFSSRSTGPKPCMPPRSCTPSMPAILSAGVHDLGGMQGFGPVEREENEPVFHAAWEAAVLAIQRAGGARGFFNIDEFRHGIERMAPAHYLRATYYEKWLDGVTRL